MWQVCLVDGEALHLLVRAWLVALAGVLVYLSAMTAIGFHTLSETAAAAALAVLLAVWVGDRRGGTSMDDINGRLDAGTRLFVLLRGMDPTAAPRSLLRAAHADLVRQQRDADAEAHAAAASELRSVELCHAKLHYCLGRVSVLRTFARHALIAHRDMLRDRRIGLLRDVIATRRAAAQFKVLRTARVAVAAAVAHGERLLVLSEEKHRQLTSAKIGLTLVGVTSTAPLLPCVGWCLLPLHLASQRPPAHSRVLRAPRFSGKRFTSDGLCSVNSTPAAAQTV
jgi:hypothetical protein